MPVCAQKLIQLCTWPNIHGIAIYTINLQFNVCAKWIINYFANFTY